MITMVFERTEPDCVQRMGLMRPRQGKHSHEAKRGRRKLDIKCRGKESTTKSVDGSTLRHARLLEGMGLRKARLDLLQCVVWYAKY